MPLCLRALLACLGLACLGPAGAACGDLALKSQGNPCFASSECEPGLLCDLAADPPTCQPTGSGVPPTDAATGQRDADPTQPDASPGTPDAAIPDAAIPDASA
jgi:hypothetical protein